jgi:hypothetical protein
VWFSRRTGRWSLLEQDAPDLGPSLTREKERYMMRPVANLPLGVIEPTDYRQFAAKLAQGDVVVVYTDALTEAVGGPDGEYLGGKGLLELLERIGPDDPARLGYELIEAVARWRGGTPAEDDQTVIVMHHNATDPPRLTVGQALKSLAKMIGLARV